MEKAIEFCKSNNIHFIKFDDLIFKDGVVYGATISRKYKEGCLSMPANEFIEMIFDMINEGIMIDLSTMIFYKDYANNKSYVKDNTYMFMNKYAMTKIYDGTQVRFVLSVNRILGDDLCTYIQDDCNRHKLRTEIAKMKTSIRYFIDNQKSYDDVTRFKRIVESL